MGSMANFYTACALSNYSKPRITWPAVLAGSKLLFMKTIENAGYEFFPFFFMKSIHDRHSRADDDPVKFPEQGFLTPGLDDQPHADRL